MIKNYGNYISRDINKSIHYLTLSTNQNNSDAKLLLGGIYYKGEYISRDINKSIHYLTLSANQNNSDAEFLLGGIYYNGKYISRDINKSIHYLTLAAEQNHSNAQCILGQIYYDKKYIEKNIKKSIHYFKEASSFNHEIAKNYLGIIYKNGDGVEKNIYNAIIYFNEAIKQKNSSYSMYNLARIYYFGIDIERDILKSIELLKNASKNQYSLSLSDLFLFYIFTYCDDSKFLNQKESLHYQNNFSFWNYLLIYFHINDYYINQKLYQFFKEYDLIESYDYSYDLYYFLYHGTFYDWRNQNDKIISDKSIRKDINDDFYEGFYDHIKKHS